MLTGWSLNCFLSSGFNLYQRLALWLTALLLLTRFSPVSALLTVLIVSLQVALGESLIGRLSGFNHISKLAKVGLGFCLGATISTFFYVLVVTFTGPMVAIISQIVLFVFAFFLRLSQISSTNVQATSDELGAVKWLAVVALLGLAPNWFWPLPVAIWLAFLFVVWPRLKNGFSLLKLMFSLLMSASGGLIWSRIIDTRPDRAWFADDRFVELFSFSLGKWGVSHNPMLISESISYHWFSFAWIGVISNLAFSKVDVVVAQFGPVIIAMTCAVLGFAIIKAFTRNTTVALVSLALAVSVDTERLFEGYGFNAFQLSSFSQFFSLALGLSLLLVVISLDNQQLRSVAVIVGVIFAGLIGSKISSGLVASFGLGGVWLVGLIKDRRARGHISFLVVAILAPAIFALPTFYGDPRSDSGSLFRRPGWPVGVSRDLWDVYNGSFVRYLPILIFLSLAFGGIGFMGLFITLKSKFLAAGIRNSKIFLSFGLIASLAQMWIRGGNGSRDLFEGNVTTLYAFHFSISLIRFVAVALVVEQVYELCKSRKLRIILISLVFPCLFVFSVIRYWEIGVEASYLVPLFVAFKPVIPLVLAIVIAIALSVYVRNKWQLLGFESCPNTFVVLSNSVLITAGMFLFISNYVNVSSRQQKEWRSMDVEYSVSTDFEAATNWLSSNMRRDDVVAAEVTRSSPRVAVLTGHKDFAGVQVSFRIFGENSKDYAQNYKSIDQFGNNGSCQSTQELRESGVNFFLVDLSDVDTPDILRCADEVFRNKSTIVYKIK